MSESKINLIEPQRFTINLPSTGPPVAVRTEGDEIVVLMRFTLRPRDNVMNIDIDVSASGDGAAMASLDEDSAAQISRDWGSVVAIRGHDGCRTTKLTGPPPISRPLEIDRIGGSGPASG